MVSLIEEAFIKVQVAKRLILMLFFLVAFNYTFNAGHAVEVVNAPTVDPSKVQKQAADDIKEVSIGGFEQQDLYDGPGIEIPNLIDVIKEKKQQKQEITREEAIQTSYACLIMLF